VTAYRRRPWLYVAAVVPTALVALLLLGHPAGDSAAWIAFLGVVVTAAVTYQSDRRLSQEHEDDRARLRLDAAMQAGSLLAPGADGRSDPAATASGLLALTRLDHAELAVALLAELWVASPGDTGTSRVSTETAVLVLDAALRSDQANAQLLAAELLVRNAPGLDPCRSLHWPSVIDGRWRPDLGQKTKLLLLDALATMTFESDPNENALRTVAVRLYGIWEGDPDRRVRGCVGTLVKAVLPVLERLDYTEYLQGPMTVTLDQLRNAAAAAAQNPDGYLERIALARSERLEVWSRKACERIHLGPGSLGTGVYDCAGVPIPSRLTSETTDRGNGDRSYRARSAPHPPR
jgi:hypothetical protein